MTKTDQARVAWGRSYVGTRDINGVRIAVRMFPLVDSSEIEDALERLDALEKALSAVLPAPKPETRA